MHFALYWNAVLIINYKHDAVLIKQLLSLIRSFISISTEVVSQLATSGVSGVLRAKLCFTIFRCMAEDRVAGEFLLRCDSQSYVASPVQLFYFLKNKVLC